MLGLYVTFWVLTLSSKDMWYVFLESYIGDKNITQKLPFIRPKKSHCFLPNLILEATPKICTLVRFAPQSLVTLSPSHDFFYGQSTPAIQMYSHTPTLSPSTPCPPRSRHSGACPSVETDLVWLPTLEMMDWWLTYVKVQGGSSGKQAQSCIKYGVGWREKETGLWFIQCALKLEVSLIFK